MMRKITTATDFLNAACRRLRESRVDGMTHKEIAAHIGITPSMLTKWRSGQVDLHQVNVSLKLLALVRYAERPPFITDEYEQWEQEDILYPFLKKIEEDALLNQWRVQADLWDYIYRVWKHRPDEVRDLLDFTVKDWENDARRMLALGVHGVLAIEHLAPNPAIRRLAQDTIQEHPWIRSVYLRGNSSEGCGTLYTALGYLGLVVLLVSRGTILPLEDIWLEVIRFMALCYAKPGRTPEPLPADYAKAFAAALNA